MSRLKEKIKVIVDAMRRFADQHWMHPECQKVRVFADQIDEAVNEEKEGK